MDCVGCFTYWLFSCHLSLWNVPINRLLKSLSLCVLGPAIQHHFRTHFYSHRHSKYLKPTNKHQQIVLSLTLKPNVYAQSMKIKKHSSELRKYYHTILPYIVYSIYSILETSIMWDSPWLPFSQLPFGMVGMISVRNTETNLWRTVPFLLFRFQLPHWTSSCSLDSIYTNLQLQMKLIFQPLSARVYVNLPEGNVYHILSIWIWSPSPKLQSHYSYYNYQTIMELETTSSNQTWINEHKENTHIWTTWWRSLTNIS